MIKRCLGVVPDANVSWLQGSRALSMSPACESICSHAASRENELAAAHHERHVLEYPRFQAGLRSLPHYSMIPGMRTVNVYGAVSE
ncbi:unnamed protein product [Angiostrongylus costaricensis]|uniref:Uncharacterized protein n=1 Tax=Angiostrongylus costaricensis TaxID=334426 RepID=A0A0R3PJU5_ANGCS|nr:unnamed protein product [Angiostrongylus costaricensis]